MKKWILVIIVLINLIVIFYAITPKFGTFAQIYPENITFIVDNYISIQDAIIKTHYEGLESGRKFFGSGSFNLMWLTFFNIVIIIYLYFKCKKQ